MIKRSITASVIVAFQIGGLLLGSYTFLFVFASICILGIWEFYSLSYKNNSKPQKYYGTIVAIFVFVSNFLFANELVTNKIFLLYVPILIFILIYELFRNQKLPFVNIAFSLLGIIYVAVPFSLLNYLVHFEINNQIQYNPEILLGIFFLIWSYDTGAYFIGSNFGKHRLFERISPKKSWEGSIGGAILAILVASFVAGLFKKVSFSDWLVIATIIIIMGTFGDLIESMLKRSINIKDSGTILPGHGGILDRFDSILIASPMIFAYIKWLEP